MLYVVHNTARPKSYFLHNTILVLFMKKANSSLRFYINYYMLNNLTYKDRYPLPLIDKTLARLAGA
ncbi:hypothetical protein PZA11_004903 [Diplocarpon coronariae]